MAGTKDDLRESGRIPKLTVIAPCLNEEESIPAFLDQLVPVLEEMTSGDWRILFVDDGSTDSTYQTILDRHGKEPRITGISLSRNFGHQAAITAGLTYADADFVAVIDCDLQDPVEVLRELYRKVSVEEYDVALGIRSKREAPLWLRICYPLFYRAISRVSEHQWPLDAGDFSVFNRKVRQALLSLPERDRMLRGLRSWVGFRQASVKYERPARRQGQSKYTPLRLISLALSAFVGFTTFPLRLASVFGFAMSLGTLSVGFLLLINRLFPKFTIFGYYVGENPGVTTIVLYVSFVSGMLFFCLGIIGEYIGVIVKEIKKRPSAIVAQKVGVGTSKAGESQVVSTTIEPIP